MEFMRLIFSSFWAWLGLIILVSVIGDVLIRVIKSCKRNRRIEAYRIGNKWKMVVENASARDMRQALNGPQEEETEGGACTDQR